MPEVSADAASIIGACNARGLTIATAESITAGLVSATLAEVPGCSAVLRGGIVAYQADVKRDLLSVSDADLARGVVSEAVARAMAIGAAGSLAADVGIGTTGVAGPDPHDGEPVGSVWVAVSGPWGVTTRHLQASGTRAGIRRQTVLACFDLLAEGLGSSPA